jgi:hypothetical protein
MPTRHIRRHLPSCLSTLLRHVWSYPSNKTNTLWAQLLYHHRYTANRVYNNQHSAASPNQNASASIWVLKASCFLIPINITNAHKFQFHVTCMQRSIIIGITATVCHHILWKNGVSALLEQSICLTAHTLEGPSAGRWSPPQSDPHAASPGSASSEKTHVLLDQSSKKMEANTTVTWRKRCADNSRLATSPTSCPYNALIWAYTQPSIHSFFHAGNKINRYFPVWW